MAGFGCETNTLLIFTALWALVATYQSVVLRTVTTVTLSRPFMRRRKGTKTNAKSEFFLK